MEEVLIIDKPKNDWLAFPVAAVGERVQHSQTSSLFVSSSMRQNQLT